jgi:hypothetical protein
MSRTAILDRGEQVAKKKKPGPGSGGRQVAFRAPDDLYADLERAAHGLGLDVSNLIRMILRRHVGAYLQQVEEIERQREGGE